MAKIKICGLFRDEDVGYVNEAGPDYAGFVFAGGRRGVDFKTARRLRQTLAAGIESVGVFVNAHVDEIAALYSDGIIGIAQLHGGEDEPYIARLKERCDVRIIKTVLCPPHGKPVCGETAADFLLFDSGCGSGKAFDWPALGFTRETPPPRRWFLAGGINLGNIAAALSFKPFCIDVSSGTESGGLKDRLKMMELVRMVRNAAETEQVRA
ncbi:MAG: phosphoribosylanthranilate isomerase [Spirochaetaceae bacterium]|nr:phosphoribosylanthranilate isomerase [Spirochaetaceae bacterium]